MEARDVDTLAGTMLNVDLELHADLAARELCPYWMRRGSMAVHPREISWLIAQGERASWAADLAEGLCIEAELLGTRGVDSAAAADATAAAAAAADDNEEEEASSSSSRAASAEAAMRPPRAALGRPDLQMRASLISACGAAGQLPRALDEYRALEQRTGMTPPGSLVAIALMEACVACSDLDAAFDVFHSVRRSKRFEVKAGALAPLVRGCARLGDTSRAAYLSSMASFASICMRSRCASSPTRAATTWPRTCTARRARRACRWAARRSSRACLLAGDWRAACSSARR